MSLLSSKAPEPVMPIGLPPARGAENYCVAVDAPPQKRTYVTDL